MPGSSQVRRNDVGEEQHAQISAMIARIVLAGSTALTSV